MTPSHNPVTQSSPFQYGNLPKVKSFPDLSTVSTEISNSESDRSWYRSGVRDSTVPMHKSHSESHTSSTSNSGTEEFSFRVRPKKPRPLNSPLSNPSSPDNLPNRHHGGNRVRNAQIIRKPWASLSYWEAHRHIGHRWYEVTRQVLNVLYDNGKQECDEVKGDAHCSRTNNTNEDRVYLSLLSSSQSGHSKLRIRDNRLHPELFNVSTHCKTCGNIVHKCDEPRFTNANGSFINPVRSSSCTKMAGWKQCYRLGSQGISLTITSYGCIWLDNQTAMTNLPVFVSSPCLILESSSLNSDWPVFRVPAGYSILIFDSISYRSSTDPEKVSSVRNKTNKWSNFALKNPVVHISLGKGWGPSYRRPDVTHCPARLEIWIDVEQLASFHSC